MKSPRFFLLMALLLIAGNAVRAFDPVKGPSQTEVIYFEPEKFTDASESSMGDTEKGRNATLAELREYVVKQAGRLLAPGQQLKITVTDVDLAGEFEPWLGPRWDDVRVVKDIYPPRIKLAFQLTDAAGQVLKKGDRDLRDLDFMMKLTMDQSDPLRFEKNLLSDWLREEFHAAKKK